MKSYLVLLTIAICTLLLFAYVSRLGVPGTIGLVFLIGLYFIPTIVADTRNHKNYFAILVLNLFLGWTFLGWVIALVWAVSK